MGAPASVGARGPERNAPEASVGLPPGRGNQSLFPPEEAGGIFPALSTEKSAPYDSKRAGLAPGPWKHLAPKTLLFQMTKVLRKKKKFRFDLQDVYCSLRDNFSFASRQIVVLRFLGSCQNGEK